MSTSSQSAPAPRTASDVAEARTAPAVSEPAVVEVAVEGLSCASCVGQVERALGALPGVAAASVNLASEQARVVFTGAPDVAAVRTAVEAAGYRVAEATTDLAIEGMHCASCVGRVERALAAVPGVVRADVNLATERAVVRHVAGAMAPAALIAAVNVTGYGARVADGGDANEHEARKAGEIGALRRDVTLAAVLTLPVFTLEMGAHLVPALHHAVDATIGREVSWLIQFALTTLVLVLPGRRFFTTGIPALVRGAPDMNALVALGAGAAWAYSTVATFAAGLLPAGTANIYFEAAAVIVTLILVGRLMEARAKGRTGQAIRRLVGLRAKTARVLRDGRAVDVPLEEVVVGDLALVRPGETVPVDGLVVEGSSYVDQSMITGEPVPAARGAGDEVVGGTLNKTGAFTVRATRVGADTVLSQIIRMVGEAQGAKLPIQALVDRVTSVFVPIVMAVAAVTFLAWLAFGPDLSFALVNAVAVLIIACPCAMGLATPTSIMVGTGRAAELGILMRRGEALQALKDVAVVAFDKTGTLTEGQPALTDLVVADGFEEAEVLSLVASVEATSEHPIAAAIVAAAQERGLATGAVRAFEALPGYGVEAHVDGQRVAVGADRHMARLGLDVSGFAADVARLGEAGKTPLYAAVDGRIAAILAVADPVKPSTAAALAALRGQGLRVAMVTGDNERAAHAVAASLDIDEVVAEVLPGGKVDAVTALRTRGPVAFVGDGINDAPALAAADVGIAIGTGTDVAIEAADVVLMSDDIAGVANAVHLSRATMANIRQNLFWAFAYNVALIPVAAGALYPAFGLLLSPVFAAGAMALSSVFVVTNALRLTRVRPVARDEPNRLAAVAGATA